MIRTLIVLPSGRIISRNLIELRLCQQVQKIMGSQKIFLKKVLGTCALFLICSYPKPPIITTGI
jgi:hypothetical protein